MSQLMCDGTLVPCPFDPNHKVSERRIKFHTIACAAKHRGMYDVCKYNDFHFVPLGELHKHYHACPDFMAIIQDVKSRQEKEKVGLKAKVVEKVAPQVKPSEELLKPLISFDDEGKEKQKNLVMTTTILAAKATAAPVTTTILDSKAANRIFEYYGNYDNNNNNNIDRSRNSSGFSSCCSTRSSSFGSCRTSSSNGYHLASDTSTSITTSTNPEPPPGGFALTRTVVNSNFHILTPFDWDRLKCLETFEPLTKFQVQTMTKGERSRYHRLLIRWQKWKNANEATTTMNGLL